MVRFPCFNGQFHSDKPKKAVKLSVDSMQKTLQDCAQNQALNDFNNSSELNSLNLKAQRDAILNSNVNHAMISSIAHGWKSEEINGKYSVRSNRGVSYSGRIKKSLSLGSGLDRAARTSAGKDSDDETDLGNSLDGFHQNNGMVVSHSGKDLGISVPHQCQGPLPCDSFQVGSDLVNNGPIFSIGDPQQSEKGGGDKSDTRFSGESAAEFSERTPRKWPIILKSNSLPMMGVGTSGERSALTYLAPHARSSEDLAVLELRQKEMVIHDFEGGTIFDQERDATVLNSEKNNCEIPVEAGYDSYNYVGSAKDWIVPIMDEVSAKKSLHGESSACQREEVPSKYFQIKRVEEWIIDLQHCSPFEETNDGLSNLDEHQVQKGSTVADNLTARRFDGKITPGMEAAKKYISSLSATATTVQLVNHGLAVIPFLSAFVSLRALNLSGNAIVRITAGALPRGLHILNLSKNNISNIEGLRELTRLRVLDLSYNRIVRIGHGLASCSSLKELYLAGNKISEVEGLHRLLKLNVLDLRFNKISTAKCLDQLAANYSSLQAISLDGNPAQKNVGDEQLKKHLQGFLPHLAYYNRQSIKAGTLKDGADRLTRLGITTDRGHRSEHKSLRKGSHSASAHKTSLSSSIRGHRNQAAVSSKPSKGRHGRVPPTAAKATSAHKQNFHDFGGEVLSSRPDLSMRRTQSEGTLAAL